MSKKAKIIIAISAVVVFVLVVGLLGVAIGANSNFARSAENYYPEESTKNIAAEGFSTSDLETSFVNNEDEDQKLVYNGSVTIGTENIKRSYRDLADSLGKYKAKVESLNESIETKNISIRVPKEHFFALYDSLSDITGDITASDVSVEDMTKTYKDNERRLDILKTEYNELKELMKSAKNVKEVLQIKDRMTELTYEIESLRGDNDTIDYDSKYSVLNVELVHIGSSPAISFWTQVKEAFSNSIQGIRMVILGLISVWWVIALIGGGIWFAYRRVGKK